MKIRVNLNALGIIREVQRTGESVATIELQELLGQPIVVQQQVEMLIDVFGVGADAVIGKVQNLIVKEMVADAITIVYND